MKNFFGAVLLLAATIYLVNFSGTVQPVAPLKPLSEFPANLGDFQVVNDRTFGAEVLGSLGVDHYIMRAYKNPDGYLLWLYIGFYESQSQGEIIHSPKHCMPGSGWNPVINTEVTLAGGPVIDQMLLQKGEERQLAHYWYQGRGRVVANEYVDRGYMVLDSLLKKRSDGALIRITGPGADFAGDTRKQHHFAQELLAVLDEYLPS
ncbi:MAG: exosortase C-terminal domain/associated protein EpsI [Thermodesulfobacteriota bacterium]